MDARADIEDFFNEAPCGLVSVDADGEIVRINRTLADWLGADTQSLIGSAFRDVLSVGGRIAFETHIRPMLKMQGQVNEISFDLLDSTGERIPFITNISERRDADDALISTRFALFKSNDRRLYEKTLLKARQIAEDEAKRERSTALLRDQFIAVLGHDLRNPLSAIISGVRIIKRRTELTEQLNLVLDNMMDSAWRAEKLVKDILDFALGTLGDGLVLQCRAVTDLDDALAQVVEEIKLGASDRIIQSRFEISQPVFCDKERIGQMLSNLLANAISHGDPARETIVEAFANTQQFSFSVENFGEPIPEALKENLFKPFFRGDVRENRQGLGLGLFIVLEIAKAHGGQVAVVSNDKSTKFSFEMPNEPQEKSD